MDGKEFFLIYLLIYFFVNEKLDQNKPFLIINNVVVYQPAEAVDLFYS